MAIEDLQERFDAVRAKLNQIKDYL